MSVALSKMNKKELYAECKRLLQDNMRLQLFQDDNLIKENQDFKREKLMLHNVCNEYKKENNKLTEEVLERDTHIEMLDKEVEELKYNVSDFEDTLDELKEDREEWFREELDDHIKDACVGSNAEYDFDGACHLEGIHEKYCKLKEEIKKLNSESSDSEESEEEEDTELSKCVKCCRDFYIDASEYKWCMVCPDCQKYA